MIIKKHEKKTPEKRNKVEEKVKNKKNGHNTKRFMVRFLIDK